MRSVTVAVLLAIAVAIPVVHQAQTTIYWSKDHIYAGAEGKELAIVTPTPSDTTAPTAPSSLASSSVTATSVYLSWTGSTDSGGSGLAGYKVYRQVGSGASLPVGTVTATSFTDQPLQPSTSYTYVILAFDNAQNHSSASGSVSITTSSFGTDTTPPGVPPNLTGYLLSSTSVRLIWGPSYDQGGSGINGYNVYRGGTLITSTPLTSTTFDDTGLAYNTSYSYTVKAVDNASNLSSATGAFNITSGRQILFQDNFNRSDASTLGSTWTVQQDYFTSLSLASSRAYATYHSGGWSFNAMSPSTSTYKASLDVVYNNLSAGIIFWTREYGVPYFDYDDCAWETQNELEGYRVLLTSGVLELDSCDQIEHDSCSTVASVSAPSTGTISVQTTASTGGVQVYLNGVLEINTSVGYNGGGGLGLAAHVNSGQFAILDNFLIESN